jgi:hypothetical protein
MNAAHPMALILIQGGCIFGLMMLVDFMFDIILKGK